MAFFYFYPIVLIAIVILCLLIRYAFERIISRVFKSISIERTSILIFVRSFILIFFNVGNLILFGLFTRRMFSFAEAKTGVIVLAIGFTLAIILALLSLLAIRAGFGSGYKALVESSKLDKGFTLATFIFLAGPSEDLFFIGFAQNALTPYLAWGAIIVYLSLFIAYHYANVINGVEKKEEFLGTLPVRLTVSILLSLSFYFTKTLMYGFVVHNLVDTLSYVVLLYAAN